MTLITYILIILLFLYIIISILTLYGIQKKPSSDNNITPFVSVIIAARNEESVIQNLLASLKKINYPQENIEYLLINDRSEDNTGELMKQFTHQIKNSRIININHLPSGRTGKINALIHGIQAAKGELFFLTDADCEVPENWVDSFIKYFDAETGIAGGFIVLDKKNINNPLFHYLQSIDWIFFCSLACAWTNLGKPLSIFGNNVVVKKNIYEQCNGFESIHNHITEDYALMKNVLIRTRAKVHFVLDPEITVYTNPAKTIRSFFTQRKRWAASSTKRGALSIILSLISLLTRILIIIALITNICMMGLAALLLVTLMDILILYYPLKKLKRLYLLKYLFFFEIYFTLYQLFFTPIALFAKKIVWKSDNYAVN